MQNAEHGCQTVIIKIGHGFMFTNRWQNTPKTSDKSAVLGCKSVTETYLYAQCIQVGNFGFKSVAQKLAARKYFKIGDQSAVLRHFAYKYVAQTELYPKYPKTAQSAVLDHFWVQICGPKVGRPKILQLETSRYFWGILATNLWTKSRQTQRKYSKTADTSAVLGNFGYKSVYE